LGNASEACNLVRVLSYDLEVIPEALATTQPTGPASRRQVQALIQELLDDTDQSRGYVTSLQVERMMEYDLAKNPMSIGVWGPEMRPILEAFYRPVFDLDAIRIMENTTKTSNAGLADSWRAAQAALPNVDKLFTGQTTATGSTRLLSVVIMPAFHRAVLNQYRNRTLRRVAALRLAIRLYQSDHDGQFPRTLEQLVPTYIAAVPRDPFSPGGLPLQYRAAPAPMIYSAGEDGNDDVGDTALRVKKSTTAPAGSPDDDYIWDRRDVIFPLQRYIRPPPTTDES
jgi:hypothetical protein